MSRSSRLWGCAVKHLLRADALLGTLAPSPPREHPPRPRARPARALRHTRSDDHGCATGRAYRGAAGINGDPCRSDHLWAGADTRAPDLPMGRCLGRGVARSFVSPRGPGRVGTRERGKCRTNEARRTGLGPVWSTRSVSSSPGSTTSSSGFTTASSTASSPITHDDDSWNRRDGPRTARVPPAGRRSPGVSGRRPVVDLGTGLPTVRPTRGGRPGGLRARVVYVDSAPRPSSQPAILM